MATRTVEVRLKAHIADFKAGMASAGAGVDELQRKLADNDAKTKANVREVSRGMVLVGAAGVAAAGTAIKAFADFDKEMSNVKAVSNAGAAAMDDLSDAALEAGADTVFSASEAAKAEAELARAGVKTADILGGALRGSLALAAAGQLELADAATISAQAMNIFKLRGQDVGHIADVLAAGANKSAADVKSLGDALRQGGLVAAQTGLDLEETVGGLAAFADSALVGSDAGTSFKTMLQRLLPQSEGAADAMEAIGFNAFDAQGNFVGLAEVAGQLQEGLGRLTAEQRAATMQTIFGSDAVRAANVLYEQGEEGIRDYTKAVDDQGAAQRMAATQLDNLAGDVEAFRGSLETAFIKGGSSANGFARVAVQGATSVVNAYSDLPVAVQGAGTAIVGVGGAVTAAIGGIGIMVPKIKEGREALRQLGTAGQFADRSLGRLGRAAGKGGLAFAGLVAFTSALEAVQDHVIETGPGIDTLTKHLLSLREGVKDAGVEDLDRLGEAFDDLADQGAFLRTMDSVSDSLLGLKSAGTRESEEVIDNVDKALANLVSSGNAEAAARLMQIVEDSLTAKGISRSDIRKRLDDYTEALAGADNQAELAGDSSADLGNTLEDVVSPAAEEAEDAITLYTESLDALNGVNIDAARQQLALGKAYDDANKAVEKGAKVTTDETEALLDLADQANQTAGAIADQTGSQTKANDSLREARRRFMDVAQEMGYTKGEARALADQWLQIPTKRNTKYTTSGVDDAQTELSILRDTILGIPTRRSVAVTVTTVNKLAANPALLGRASGGPVMAGQLYQVNELGVELFRPATDGSIVPAGPTAALLSGSTAAPAFYTGGAGTGTAGGSRSIALTVHTHEGESVVDALPRTLDALMWKVGT